MENCVKTQKDTFFHALLEGIHVGLEAVVGQGLDDVLGFNVLVLLLVGDFARAMRLNGGRNTRWPHGGGTGHQLCRPALWLLSSA